LDDGPAERGGGSPRRRERNNDGRETILGRCEIDPLRRPVGVRPGHVGAVPAVFDDACRRVRWTGEARRRVKRKEIGR
jgi:hypothetical protein